MDYRSLAEAFRSAAFITLAGPRETPDMDQTLASAGQKWFQRAFSLAWQARPRPVVGDAHTAALEEYVVDAWLEDQRNFTWAPGGATAGATGTTHTPSSSWP